jgi:hypothetical protein
MIALNKRKFMTLVAILLSMTIGTALVFYQNVKTKEQNSSPRLSSPEGFNWAVAQYNVELASAKEDLIAFIQGSPDNGTYVDESEILTRITVLSSRGNLFIEPSEFSEELNKGSLWNKTASAKLAQVANKAYAEVSTGLTKKKAETILRDLKQVEGMAREFNVKTRLLDQAEAANLIQANEELQKGFASIAIFALLSGTVLATLFLRDAKASMKIAKLEKEIAEHATNQVELLRKINQTQHVIMEEVILKERIDSNRLTLDFGPLDIYTFLHAISATCSIDIASRLSGLKIITDSLKLKLAFKSLISMAESRGRVTIKAYRGDNTVVVEIHDDGKPLTSLNRIWEAASSDAEKAGDPAVSHYVARALIYKLGGSIECFPEKTGNFYLIELPIKGK